MSKVMINNQKVKSEQGRPASSASRMTLPSIKPAESCPYCAGKDFVRRGLRRKKLERVQLYLCRNPECGRTFTAQLVKGKRYPMRLIIAGLSYYNLGWGLAETCRVLKEKFGRPGAERPSADLVLSRPSGEGLTGSSCQLAG